MRARAVECAFVLVLVAVCALGWEEPQPARPTRPRLTIHGLSNEWTRAQIAEINSRLETNHQVTTFHGGLYGDSLELDGRSLARVGDSFDFVTGALGQPDGGVGKEVRLYFFESVELMVCIDESRRVTYFGLR